MTSPEPSQTLTSVEPRGSAPPPTPIRETAVPAPEELKASLLTLPWLAAVLCQGAVLVGLLLTAFGLLPVLMLVPLGLVAGAALAAFVFSAMNTRAKHARAIRRLDEVERRLASELAVEVERRKQQEADARKYVAESRRTEMELRAAKEAAENGARVKSEFLATMSHEIRTPMNGVLGMVELLQATELTGKQQRFAETIRRSGEALLSLINDILDFSKIEAGKLKIQYTPFDLRELLEDVGAMFAESASRKGLELACVLGADDHTAFRGDPVRIRQILINLMGNAIKFTDRGEVVVTATPVLDGDGAPGQKVIRFEVRDTGVGIEASQQARIFESFQQVDGSNSREFGGTGLGLAICSQLARLMEGDIGVESAPGSGSTFWFTVPLSEMPTEATASAQRKESHFPGKRALVLEQSGPNRDVLVNQLRAWGMRAAGLADGEKGLAALREAAAEGQPYDLVIIDKHLPGCRGVELLKRIRGIR